MHMDYVIGNANGHCGAATACPLLEAKRKTFAQCEYFAF
jgi:hypothetical protein